jgi:hypothetical protein
MRTAQICRSGGMIENVRPSKNIVGGYIETVRANAEIVCIDAARSSKLYDIIVGDMFVCDSRMVE